MIKELKSGKYICIKDMYSDGDSLLWIEKDEELYIEIIYSSSFKEDRLYINQINNDFKNRAIYNGIYSKEVEDRFNLFFISKAENRDNKINEILND